MPRPQTKNDLIDAPDLNYDKLLKLIESMTEIELNTEFDFSSDSKKLSYFISVTSSHYDWAMKKI